MELGTDVSLFALKWNFEGGAFQSHVTFDVSTLLK